MTQSPKAFGSHYLHTLHIEAFGALYQRNIGPFSEGLNVVYGANEAGKTTVNTFIGGVLFGWPEARGERNAYKPLSGERAGTLSFAPREQAQGEHEIECTRTKNAEGIKPDPEPAILDDIDEETYRTIFALNSDELLSLGRGGDITSHLLTAGAGTATSPAQALANVNAHINACLSRSGQFPNSIPNLQDEIARTKEALDASAAEAQTLKAEAREYAELQPRLNDAGAQLGSLNAEVEQLGVQCSAIERLQKEAAQLEEEHENLLAQERAATALQSSAAASSVSAALSDVRMRSAREELDDLALRQARLDEEWDSAQDDYFSAKAHFASLAESGAHQKQQAAQQRRQKILSAISIALPAIFVVAAIFLFVLSRDSAQPAPFIGAIVFTIAALVFAGLGPVLLARVGKQQSVEEYAMQDATRELDEAEQKLGMCEQKREEHNAQVSSLLAELGLQAADGNLRYARALLDDVRDARSAQQLSDQHRANLAAARESLDAKRARNTEDLQAAFDQLGVDAATPLAHIRAELGAKTAERDALQDEWGSLSTRAGQLKEALNNAQHMQAFDKLKLEDAQLHTRLEETKQEYARLLLVRRLLEEAIAAWEDKSQPEVYLQASKLLASMTEGSWREVRMNEQDQLVVVDAFNQTREPLYLSLGTCQQLYLALRIALLMTAENVGRSIPILADDILVNFDDARRVGAARALEELARVRQVIVFTCHEEVVSLMQESCADINIVQL